MGLLDSSLYVMSCLRKLLSGRAKDPEGSAKSFRTSSRPRALTDSQQCVPLCVSRPVIARHLLLPSFKNRSRSVHHSYVKLLYNWGCVFSNFSPLFRLRKGTQISVSEVLDLNKGPVSE